MLGIIWQRFTPVLVSENDQLKEYGYRKGYLSGNEQSSQVLHMLSWNNHTILPPQTNGHFT